MKKFLLLLIVILGFNFISFGQESEFDPPSIISPSPTAYELGKYGLMDVGLHTGSAETSIPIYNYNSGNLSVPISLSYRSNGIMVDQLSSNIGLGWSLNAGGVIARITMGTSDEENNLLWPQSEIDEFGIWSPTAMQFFYSIGNDDVDAEPDQYAYNFNGLTGKFIFTREKDIVLIPHRDIKIEPYSEGSDTGFRATTADGIKYIFLEQEISINRSSSTGHSAPGLPSTSAWYLSYIEHPKGDQIDFEYSSNNYFYYSSISESLKIPSPPIQKKDCSTWTNSTEYAIDSVKNKLTIVGKKLIQIKGKSDSHGQVDISYTLSHPEVSSYDIISQIKVTDESSNIIEQADFDYLSTTNDRLFLTEVQFFDPTKKYQLEYIDPNDFPNRLNYSQDHWGFYNGKSNSYKFPNPSLMDDYFIHADYRSFNIGANREIDTIYSQKGLLKKIIYPTRGHTELTYESNSYYGEKTVYPSSTTSYLSVDTDENDYTGDSDSITITNIQSDQEVEFFASIGFNDYESACEYNSYPTHHILATIIVTNLSSSQTNTIYQRSGLGTTGLGNSINITPEDLKSNCFIEFKANKNYKIELKVIRTCLTTAMNLTYFNGTIQKVDDNLKLGGSRVQKVSTYDPISNSSETKRYYYTAKESLNTSTGVSGILPFYVSDFESQVGCGIGLGAYNVNTTYKLLNSSSTRPLTNPGIGITSYEFVTVSHGGDNFENGGEEHEFYFGYDYTGNPLIGEYIQSAPWTNAGWINGLVKKTNVFKKDASGNFVVLKEINNNYKEDSRNYENIKGYSVVKKYNPILSGNVTYVCSLEDISKTISYKYCIASHDHWYLFKNCIASGNDNKTFSFDHKCKTENKNENDTITYPDQLSNLNITEYETRSYWHYLDSTTVKQFDVDGLNPVTTASKYYYDNATHLQLTKSQITDSDGNIIETKMYYPDDVDSTTSIPGGDLTDDQVKAIDTLIAYHRINIPLQTETIKNSSTNRRRVTFRDWKAKNGSLEHIVEPEFIMSSKGGDLETRLVFNDYDSYGNPLDIRKNEGSSTYYVWGYEKSKPIAKIENSEIFTTPQDTLISNAISSSNIDINITSENTLRSDLELLRAGFPNAQVTTYTYDPLIGVTSITDPKGYTTYYQYDDFGRLEFVKDQDGNILSKNQYHYKN